MTINESMIENAALTWFGELGYAVGHGPQLALCKPAAERDSFGEAVLVGRLQELPPEWLYLDGDDSLPVQLDVERVNSVLELPFTDPDRFWKLP